MSLFLLGVLVGALPFIMNKMFNKTDNALEEVEELLERITMQEEYFDLTTATPFEKSTLAMVKDFQKNRTVTL